MSLSALYLPIIPLSALPAHLSISNPCISSLLSPTSSVVSTLGNRPRLPQIKAGVSITMFTETKAPASWALWVGPGSGVQTRNRGVVLLLLSITVCESHRLEETWGPWSECFTCLTTTEMGTSSSTSSAASWTTIASTWQTRSFRGGALYRALYSYTIWHNRSRVKSVQQRGRSHTHYTW